MSQPSAFKLGYRPELDGIRGISILLVLAHHLSPSHLWGGFLGVDIFFVLSGFLITTLLIQEWQECGEISLKNFYMRRFLRLMPALFLMLLSVCGFIWLFQDSAKASAAFCGAGFTLAYISNWIQALHPNYPMGPFGITWSLSIEEQFYLFWPMLLLMFLRLVKSQRMLIILLVIGIVTVTVNKVILWNTEGVSSWRLYYGTDTRADALLIGCLVSLLLIIGMIHQRSNFEKYFKSGAAISLAFMLAIIFTVKNDDRFLYVGGGTLIELMLSVMLVVVLLWPPKQVLTVLRFPALRWFGQISYGLYLWHWPIFVIFNPKRGIQSAPYRLAAAALAIALSALSYYLIEKPALKLKRRFEASSVPPGKTAYGTSELLVQNQ
ncbi:MAG: acyltransferase family protein [Blastocatellales bacterium]